jgi:hypothetical protein
MIRYGLGVCASTDADRSLVYSYEQMFNAANGNLQGDDILKSSFSNDLARWTAWNVNLVFYKTKVLQEAFSRMEVSRLNKIEDAYEYFVLASCSNQLYSLTEFRALRYYIGRGISGRSQVSLEAFNDDQQSAYDVVQAFRRFADQTEREMVTRVAGWFDYRAHKIVADDFETRLHSGDQAQAVQKLSQTWGKEATADMLLNLMLKRANWLWGIDKYPQPNDDIVRWNELFASLKPKKFESDVVRQKYKNYTEVWGDIEFRERARVEQEKQKSAERERERQEEEEARIFRKGTLPRKVLEGAFPEGTKRRGALNSLGRAVLRR